MAETKQDQDFIITETLSKTEHFINQNKKSLSIIVGAIVLAIGGYLYYQNSYVAGKEKEAETQMFVAEEYFKNDSLKLAVNGDGNHSGFEQIISDYGVSPSANLAHFYLGMAYLKQKQYDQAIEALKGYNPHDEITPSLALGAIGDAYMEQNKTDDAIGYYEKASKEKPNNFTTPLMMMKLAGALESKGSYKEAKDVYEKIKKDYSSTSEAQQADKYIARAEAMIK
ncbi:MAG: tetratricopeptide repeat protein [Bacteroidetes bacterium]|nr:tetratricopeptide repeat protein [Bacteroidota bacterium]